MNIQWTGRVCFAALLCAGITVIGYLYGGGGGREMLMAERLETIPEGDWQKEEVFPDWKGYVDDTLAMNGMLSFHSYQGQGRLYFSGVEETESFDLFVNGRQVDTREVVGGKSYQVDLRRVTVNGSNLVQVRNVLPETGRVRVCVPYPEVVDASQSEKEEKDLEGIRRESIQFIEKLIQADVEAGFPGAQLAILRNGRLVYENAWGSICAYEQDGSPRREREPVTVDTLFDVASLTKMAVTNLCLQKLVTEGTLTLDTPVIQVLGNKFAKKVVLGSNYDGELTLEESRAWKERITLRDLLMHQAGFPASFQYFRKSLGSGVGKINPYYVGYKGDQKTRSRMVKALCKTPLFYEPRTRNLYSDLDYILLGMIIETVTGMDLDTYARETFWEPMGLTHISYQPLKHGFQRKDCAATELRGNTRDGVVNFPGIRTETLQGEVHDELAYYCMGGVSGHAGLFANASDLARLFSLMLTGGYGQHRFFSRNVMDVFTSPYTGERASWGLGWYRQAQDERVWYFGTRAGSDTIGHQGWTGTLAMVDPSDNLVVVYLTNARNSPVSDPMRTPNAFEAGFYTASTLGFVPQILSIGMDLPGKDWEWKEIYQSLSLDLVRESERLLRDSHWEEDADPQRAIFKNLVSKLSLAKAWASESGEEQFQNRVEALETQLAERYSALKVEEEVAEKGKEGE